MRGPLLSHKKPSRKTLRWRPRTSDREKQDQQNPAAFLLHNSDSCTQEETIFLNWILPIGNPGANRFVVHLILLDIVLKQINRNPGLTRVVQVPEQMTESQYLNLIAKPTLLQNNFNPSRFLSTSSLFANRTIIPKRFKLSASSMAGQLPQSFEALTNIDHKNQLMNVIKASLCSCLSETHLHLTVPGLQSKTRGKVRDIYDGGDYLVLVTTDRQSAFDRVLASIPFKGQVLNETSLWWFSKTQHIIPNAVISSPDRSVTIAKKCSVFPVEFVVRGYVTGSTDTSLWTVYQKGIRNYCENVLPEDLVKNQKLSANILTPTTKNVDHDVPITPKEIVQRGLMTQADYDAASGAALKLFEYGQRIALEHGLILVDTKYEFGKGSDGSVVLIDEVHTPDSSRYWIANSYEERFQNGHEPENIDKEFLRLWFKDHCNPYEDEVLPEAPEELVSELAWRYILLYETITKSKFEIPATKIPIHDRISENVSRALSSLSKNNHIV